MLHPLLDTSTWLDLAKRRDGQRWIVALRVLSHQGKVELLVPQVVIDEFEQNQNRVQTSMTASVAQRFRLIRQDLDDFGGTSHEQALKLIEDLARHVPLIGAMTTRNFDHVLALLRGGRVLEPTDETRRRIIERGLSKDAPFHRSRNSVADALLVELYAADSGSTDLEREPHAFITTNSDDFSVITGDKRLPHPDLAALFEPDGSSYGLGVVGLNAVLLEHFGNELTELFEETYFEEEPRRLHEIQEAEQGMFDRIWYHRSLQREYRLEDAADPAGIDELRAIAGPGVNVYMRLILNQGSWVPTRISSWTCFTASFPLSAGFWAVNGTSWTREAEGSASRRRGGQATNNGYEGCSSLSTLRVWTVTS